MSDVLVRPDGVKDGYRTGKPSSGRRGRRRGVEIKPGTVKQARLEAGLSLGQVARGDISRTAIYFVETGKAKPSMETLQLIAERTGRPLDYFLVSPVSEGPSPSMAIIEIERLIAVGDNVGAAALGESALGQHLDPSKVAQIQFHMAMAYLRLSQPLVARRLASAARVYFEQTGDLLMTAECLGSEATAAYVLEDPIALNLVEGGLATCRLLNPVPRTTESRLLMVLGNVHFMNQDWEAAIEAYQQAVAVGDSVHDLRRLSFLYSGLSAAYQELGQLEQAGRFAQRALNIHQTLNDQLSLARSENNLGVLLARAGDIVTARPHLDRSLRLFDQAGVEVGKANVVLSLAELALAKHDLAEADRLAQEACDLAERLSEFATVAEAHYWMAKVAEARGDEEAVDTEFAATFEALGRQEPGKGRAARYHAMYAEILEGRGDLVAANRQLKLALAASPPAMGTMESRSATA
jgi:tetratricopeptide (TPR) repeat protein/DNA-binding XRE family transcriptional regulator